MCTTGMGCNLSESEVSVVLVMLGMARKERVIWLQICRKKRHKYPFFCTKKIGKIQPPALQYPSVLHPIRIIQNPLELVHFK